MRRLYSFIKSKLFRVPQSGDPSSANPSPSRDKYLAYNAARARKVSQGQAYREAMADSKVLVYHYRANNRPVVRNGLAVITYEELTDILAANPSLQFSKKAIPRFAHSIDIYQSDLHTDAQAAAEPAGTHPNDGSNVACVTFPARVVMGIVAGHYRQLYIISHRTS